MSGSPLSIVAQNATSLDAIVSGDPLGYDLSWQQGALNGWAVAGTSSTSFSPMVFVRPNGEADVAVQTVNNAIVYSSSASSTAPFIPSVVAGSSTTAASAPALYVEPNGQADIVATGPNGEIMVYSATPGSGWSAVQVAPAGTASISTPSIAGNSYGMVAIAAQDVNGQIACYVRDASGTFQPIPAVGDAISSPAIAVSDSGEVDIVAQGSDNSVTWYAMGFGRGAFLPIPFFVPANMAFSAPSLLILSDGEAYVAVQGPQNSLWYYYQSAAGSPISATYMLLNGRRYANTTWVAPAMGMQSTGELDFDTWDQPYSSLNYFSTFGSVDSQIRSGTAFSPPTMYVQGTDEVDVVSTGPNNSLNYDYSVSSNPFILTTAAGAPEGTWKMELSGPEP